jgi:hypothetical protein
MGTAAMKILFAIFRLKEIYEKTNEFGAGLVPDFGLRVFFDEPIPPGKVCGCREECRRASGQQQFRDDNKFAAGFPRRGGKNRRQQPRSIAPGTLAGI